MVGRLLIWYLQDAYGNDVQIVNHHVELACLIFSLLVFPTECFKSQVVQLEGHIASNCIQTSLIVHLGRLPETFRPIDRVALRQVDFRVE